MHFAITIVRCLVEELEVRGISPAAFCSAVGLTNKMLDDPTFRIDLEHYVRIVDHALEVTDDPRLGLRVGAHVPAHGVHIVGYLSSVCSTLREAAQFFERYSTLLLASAHFTLEEEKEHARFYYEPSPLPERLLPYDTEYCLALIHRMARAITPSGAAQAVWFRHAAPADTREYQNLFGCPVRFGMEDNVIVFESRWLDVPSHHKDPALLNLLRMRADAMLSDLGAPSTIPGRVRDLIRSAQNPASLEAAAVAEALGLTERTLRRRLQSQGRAFREIADETLRQMACTALEDRHAQIKEIAFRLGFSEPSAFYRAFKRWTGVTPVEYRDGQRASSSAD